MIRPRRPWWYVPLMALCIAGPMFVVELAFGEPLKTALATARVAFIAAGIAAWNLR